MKPAIELVDRGRGLQLSTSRITVQDLVPYFQEGCSSGEIIRWIPTLTAEEIAVVERYYQAHKAELDDIERRVMAYREDQIRLQRIRFPDLEANGLPRFERLKLLLERKNREKNGEGNPG